ncbi:MAG: hypothetical protein GY742_21760 [Hyphomicrobiales bacterium]|nr:hypothetical protein [Hyphomicrobiales bacterium]
MLGFIVVVLAGVALANDLDDTPRYKKAFRDTVNNSLESQWRTPLSNQDTWRESKKSRKGAAPAFDNYNPDDLDKFRNSQSYDSNLQEQNPTLFGLKFDF